jgi:hypothetical protein
MNGVDNGVHDRWFTTRSDIAFQRERRFGSLDTVLFACGVIIFSASRFLAQTDEDPWMPFFDCHEDLPETEQCSVASV